MIKSLIIAMVGITALMTVWLLIQSLWRKTFHDYITDDDVLAERRSCNNCGCTTACSNKKENLTEQ
ncbi:MAG: hypothetical protein IPM42_01925 [Saprospiraceae bacterium]|nr:hypothetical protein [Saprospiraceae bacterium]